MKRYDSYKESGVKWLGEIPSHWEVKRLGSYFIERRVKVSDEEYEPLSVTKLGVFPQWENVAKSNDGDNRKLVKKGDFVINSRSDRKGSSGVSDRDGSVSLINIVLQPRKTIIAGYTNYLLKSYQFIEEYYRNGRGIVADLWTTRFDEMKMIKVAIPSIKEQEAIANYLDAATSKIDEAIAQQQKMIDLLNERKQIIINNAVTKGLDPNVKMKPSGIDWIGQIPAHWNVAALKRYVKLTNGDRGPNYPSGDEIKDSGILFVTADNIHNLVLDITSSAKYITEEKYNTLRGAKMRIGDIIFCLRGAGFGNCAINNTFEEGTIASSLVCITPRYINGYFLNYVLHSEFIRIQEINSSNGSCADNVSAQDLGDYMIIIPPLNEQKQIVDHIAQFDTSIDSFINMTSKQISLLQERKQIIITDVVTGKVKVV